jgi:hypothetical protein
MGETGYKQKTIAVDRFEANMIINYLQTNYVLASAGMFNLKEDGQIKIQSYGDKIEVMCNCDKNIINELEGVIEQNE